MTVPCVVRVFDAVSDDTSPSTARAPITKFFEVPTIVVCALSVRVALEPAWPGCDTPPTVQAKPGFTMSVV